MRSTGHIEIVRAGRHLAIYPVGAVPLRCRAALVQLRRGPQAQALRFIQQNPGLGALQLAASFTTSKSAACAKLKRLEAQGLVAQVSTGRYTITRLGLEAMEWLHRLQPEGTTPSAPAATTNEDAPQHAGGHDAEAPPGHDLLDLREGLRTQPGG